MLIDLYISGEGMFFKNRFLAVITAGLILACSSLGFATAQEPVLVIDPGGHSSTIWELIFTRDGRQLISAGDDKVVRIWNVETGQVERTLRGEVGEGLEGKIYAAALSPDQRILAVGGYLAGPRAKRHAVRLHDFVTGEVIGLLEGHRDAVLDLAFSPDGRLLASASGDRTLRLWEVGQRTVARVLEGHADRANGVAFSPDGKLLASGSWDKTVRLWEVAEGKLVATSRDHLDRVQRVAFSPDGRFLASGGFEGTLHLRDGKTGTLLNELTSQGDVIQFLTFSPDSNRLLAGGSTSKAQLYTLPEGGMLGSFGHDNSVFAGVFSPSGGNRCQPNGQVETGASRTARRVVFDAPR